MARIFSSLCTIPKIVNPACRTFQYRFTSFHDRTRIAGILPLTTIFVRISLAPKVGHSVGALTYPTLERIPYFGESRWASDSAVTIRGDSDSYVDRGRQLNECHHTSTSRRLRTGRHVVLRRIPLALPKVLPGTFQEVRSQVAPTETAGSAIVTTS